jgi:hypothetical protein
MTITFMVFLGLRARELQNQHRQGQTTFDAAAILTGMHSGLNQENPYLWPVGTLI